MPLSFPSQNQKEPTSGRQAESPAPQEAVLNSALVMVWNSLVGQAIRLPAGLRRSFFTGIRKTKWHWAIGAAVVQAVAIDSPANLFQNYSDMGIYALPQIEGHTNSAGLAVAIRFSLFESFSEPVLLARIRQHLGQQTTFQGLTPLTRDAFEAIRTEGVREL